MADHPTAHPLQATLERAGRVAACWRSLVIQIEQLPGEDGERLRRTLAELGAWLGKLGA